MNALQLAIQRQAKISAKEMQLYWDTFFSSTEYRENLKTRILDGEAPGMEQFLHTLVYGKPKETIQLQGVGDGVFVLQIGDHAQAHVVESGAATIIEGTAEEVQRQLTSPSDIVINAQDPVA
jgi:hypothetical protein